MSRRRFVETLGTGAGAWLLGSSLVGCGRAADPLTAWTRANDVAVQTTLRLLAKVDQEAFRGAVPGPDGIFVPMRTALFVQRATSAYLAPRSRFADSPALATALESAVEALLRMQHADGSIDLPTTNFHSPPDTAFVVEPLALAYGLLRREGQLEGLRDRLQQFLRAATESLVTGGIHTPNHRWVVCMALARLYRLFGDPRGPRRIDQWLAEGIDIDADGQYDERSVGIYSPLTNRCLITVARILDRAGLLEPVRRNLDCTLYLLHPDGSLATEASRRQDQFQRRYGQDYYYSYVYLAAREGNRRYAAAARHIAATAGLERLHGQLAYFQEDPGLLAQLPDPDPLPRQYVRHFAASDLLRVRRGPIDATFLADNPVFFSMRKSTCTLRAVRLATAFFGKGQFVGESLRQQGDAYEQEQNLEGPYFQPLHPEQYQLLESGTWEEVRRERAESEVQRQRARVTLREVEGGFDLDIRVEGTTGVPLVLELVFDPEGYLSNAGPLPETTDHLLPEGAFGLYHHGNDILRFGPGRQAHRWTRLRGALPPMAGDTVFLTGFTPWQHTLQLR